MSGLIVVKSNQDLDRERDQAIAMAEQHKVNTLSSLAAYLNSLWEEAKLSKEDVHKRLIDCLQRKKGKYSEQKLSEIRDFGGSEIYMGITSAKCRAAKSWIQDIFSSSGDTPWSVEPTPIAELPNEVQQSMMQEAVKVIAESNLDPELVESLMKEAAENVKAELQQEAESRNEKLAEKIEDIVAESNFREAFDSFIDDFTVYPTAFFEAPVYRRKTVVTWQRNEAGYSVPVKSTEISIEFDRVSPFDVFPTAHARNMSDDIFIRRQYTRSELSSFKGVAGFDTQAIDAVLLEYGTTGLSDWLTYDFERTREEGRRFTWLSSKSGTIDALEFRGNISGKMLNDFGLKVEDESQEYSAEVIKIAHHIIRAKINPNPIGSKRLHSASWEKIPDSVWGIALPERLIDAQDACNAAVRALVNNMAICSGPQATVEVDMLPSGYTDIANIHPMKVWQVSRKGLSGALSPVSFFQPSCNANELLGIYERFSKYADEITGLPAWAYGSDNGAGAAKTASGLSMLMNAASKGIKQIIRTVDIGVIEPMVRDLHIHIMLFDDDESIKGDVKIKARGSDELLIKEQQQIRRMELLQTTANPIDMEIIGLEGRSELLRRAVKSMDIGGDDIVPSDEELKQRLMAQAQQQMQQPAPQPPMQQ